MSAFISVLEYVYGLNAIYMQINIIIKQHAKKVVSDSLWLVDFGIGLVIFVLNLPKGQVLFFGRGGGGGGIQIAEVF